MSAMGKVGPEPEQDQTGLVKIDTINRISVSKLDFTVPLPDGSPRKVLTDFPSISPALEHTA